jgi:mono/diheme cytochrome c family protein
VTTPVRAVERGVTVEYGRYLAAGCVGCHGAGYSGGKIPGTPPDFLPTANLTLAVPAVAARDGGGENR